METVRAIEMVEGVWFSLLSLLYLGAKEENQLLVKISIDHWITQASCAYRSHDCLTEHVQGRIMPFRHGYTCVRGCLSSVPKIIRYAV